MATTRAALMREYAQPLSIEQVRLPETLAPGGVIVDVLATTLCGTDAHMWDGRLRQFINVKMPSIFGHEMVGTVVETGPGEAVDALGRELKPGTRIAFSAERACGHCYGCTVLGTSTACEHHVLGFMQSADEPPYVMGGLADRAYVAPGTGRVVVPDDVNDSWGAAANCAVKTTLRAFANGGGVVPGEPVVIQGSGPLGLFGTAMARAHGASMVITIGAPEARLELARAWGADHTISIEAMPDADERIARVLELTGGRGAPLVLELSGGSTANREGAMMCAAHGSFVLVGIGSSVPDPIPLGAVMGKEIKICGSTNGNAADLYKSLKFLSDNKSRFDWDAMFDAPVGLAGATGALASMSEMHSIKPLIVPSLDA